MKRRVPEWYRNAKLGIMVHWGLPSIPAFAHTEEGPVSDSLARNDWVHHFMNNPYSEWYQNSLRLGAPEVIKYHNRKFNPLFNDEISGWDPGEWADLFSEVGARYVVFVSKHHDGFLMWPSRTPPPTEGYVTSRDVVGELGEAVRSHGLRYGLYYSGLLDWVLQKRPIRDFSDILEVGDDDDFADYIRSHFEELITDYKPDILWNDIGAPKRLPLGPLFQLYRRTVPDGVLNDRWSQSGPVVRGLVRRPGIRRRVNEIGRRAFLSGKPFSKLGDVPTVEYGTHADVMKEPWEAVRSIGNSFAFNQQETPEDYLSGVELGCILADTVSKNGNLLLNVGPQSDGTIPREQRTALLDLAEWLRANGEAIYETRPWHRAEGQTSEGVPVRFTTRENTLYAILLDRPTRLSVELTDIDTGRIPGSAGPAADISVSLLGYEHPIQWRLGDRSIEVGLPGSFVHTGPVVIAIRTKPEEPRPRRIEMYTDVIG
jgi:alpha-L-fucosidase